MAWSTTDYSAGRHTGRMPKKTSRHHKYLTMAFAIVTAFAIVSTSLLAYGQIAPMLGGQTIIYATCGLILTNNTAMASFNREKSMTQSITLQKKEANDVFADMPAARSINSSNSIELAFMFILTTSGEYRAKCRVGSVDTYSATVTYTKPAPDLTVTGIDIARAADPGQAYFRVRVANIGTSSTPGSYVKQQMVGVTMYYTGPNVTGPRNIMSSYLDPGISVGSTYIANLPFNGVNGTYQQVTACVNYIKFPLAQAGPINKDYETPNTELSNCFTEGRIELDNSIPVTFRGGTPWLEDGDEPPPSPVGAAGGAPPIAPGGSMNQPAGNVSAPASSTASSPAGGGAGTNSSPSCPVQCSVELRVNGVLKYNQ